MYMIPGMGEAGKKVEKERRTSLIKIQIIIIIIIITIITTKTILTTTVMTITATPNTNNTTKVAMAKSFKNTFHRADTKT